MNQNRKAFTLIELLVVIVIIGILAAFVVPAVAGAKKRALVSTCQKRLNQLATATIKWSQDNNGSWLSKADWPLLVNPYLTDREPEAIGGEFRCPAGDAYREFREGISWKWTAVDYACVSNTYTKYEHVEEEAKGPEQAMFVDFLQGFDGMLTQTRFTATLNAANEPKIFRHPAGRVSGGNIVFLDGHTSLMRFTWPDLVP